MEGGKKIAASEEGENGLTTQEMLSMVRFGANKIFASKGNNITDEDIEAILKRYVCYVGRWKWEDSRGEERRESCTLFTFFFLSDPRLAANN